MCGHVLTPPIQPGLMGLMAMTGNPPGRGTTLTTHPDRWALSPIVGSAPPKTVQVVLISHGRQSLEDDKSKTGITCQEWHHETENSCATFGASSVVSVLTYKSVDLGLNPSFSSGHATHTAVHPPFLEWVMHG